MDRAREAIVFVPGMDSLEQNVARDVLVKGLVNSLEGVQIDVGDEVSIEGVQGVRLQVRDAADDRAIDVFEAFWGDLRTYVSDMKPPARMKHGLLLLAYWLISPTWRVIGTSKYMTVSLMGSCFLLMGWYFSTVVLGLTALGSQGEDQWAATLGAWGEELGGWKAWAAISALLAMFPVAAVVDIAFYSKQYLTNERRGDGVGQRDKVRKRVLRVLEPVLRDGGYDRVTLLAHSFGTVIGIDILADLKPETRVRFLTLASPVEFMKLRSRWLRDELDACLRSDAYESWIDYYSDEDWVCWKIPHDELPDRVDSRQVDHGAPLLEKLQGQTHGAYFSNGDVMRTLIS